MPNNLIGQLFSGDICPSARRPGGYEFDSKVHEIIELEGAIKGKLTDEDWQMVEALIEAKNSALALSCEEMFREGFSLAVCLLSEAIIYGHQHDEGGNN